MTSRPRAANAPSITTNQGKPLSTNQHALKAGPRGPVLLEDFVLREKITHFDHERIPERVVHARGSAAHGTFECLHDCSAWTRAAFLGRKGLKTPVFTRFSTVAGGAGSADTVRDVRGFAVKFYTEQGNFDLVGNNIPVFFVQDAMKFPDLVHAVKMEPDRGFPQAASAHDTFWDFVSLVPESTHMLLWAMSSRTLPRSLRMVDGFGVHTFRFVNAKSEAKFVKFHWRAELGVESTTWDEAVKLAGADPDYHRRDLWEALERGDQPAWQLCVQVFSDEQAAQLPLDVLDPTKLIPEELVPLQVVGRMVLERNPDNFFAETEQVAYCPAHLVPGIDFSEDPLLQGRLFSYTDTQLSRLGSANFHQLPVNRPRCPLHNFQRDGMMQADVPTGRVNYEPQSLDPDAAQQAPQLGFRSAPAAVHGHKLRERPPGFDDHYSQARQFYLSQTAHEQGQIAAALAFELAKVQTPAVRLRVLGHMALVADELMRAVAARLGLDSASVRPPKPAVPPRELPAQPSLSMHTTRQGGLQGRCVGVLLADGADGPQLAALQRALGKAGARVVLVAERRSGVQLAGGKPQPVDAALSGAPSCLYDHVAVLGAEPGIAALAGQAPALAWLRDAWCHLKVLGLDAAGQQLARAAGIGQDDAVVALATKNDIDRFCQLAAKGKHTARQGAPGTDQ